MWRVGKAPNSTYVLDDDSFVAECSTHDYAARIVAAMNAAETLRELNARNDALAAWVPPVEPARKEVCGTCGGSKMGPHGTCTVCFVWPKRECGTCGGRGRIHCGDVACPDCAPRKAVCHDCGGPILHTWCLEVAAKQRALGMPEHAPVRCVDCLWTRICRIADANG